MTAPEKLAQMSLATLRQRLEAAEEHRFVAHGFGIDEWRTAEECVVKIKAEIDRRERRAFHER